MTTKLPLPQIPGQFFRLGQKYFKRFEGGFPYITNKLAAERFPAYEKYLEEFNDCIYRRRISMGKYIEKTQRSAIVFNTPAVSGCLGWKLGEYLCMGKAIISSPLNRVLPGSIKDLNFVRFVVGTEKLQEAIKQLQQDDAYRGELERNAAAYFKQYLTPQVMIARIVKQYYAQKME